MIHAVTGHRYVDLKKFTDAMTSQLEEYRPDVLIVGMAEGADLLAGKIALDLKVPVICAMPWTTHYASIKGNWRNIYSRLLDNCVEAYPVVEAEEYPGPFCYHERNRWMVDESDRMIAWWDGREGGGTYETVKYANKVQKPVRNIYEA